MENQHPIIVICDRCRERGSIGGARPGDGGADRADEDPFAAFGALLDFEPVPRLKVRADGWDAEVQRCYVAALSLTGSARQAARAVGKAAFGVQQLLASPGSEGFRAACEEAMRMAADERSRRLAEGLAAVAAEQSGRRPADPPWAKAASRRPTRAMTQAAEQLDRQEEKVDWTARIVGKYMIKVREERKARLAGEIVTADFYLRQLTYIEVVLDLVSTDGFQALMDFRHADHHLVHIAETPFSKLLGEARREKWAEFGDPPRPEHPPRRYLIDRGRFSTEPLESTRGGQALSHNEQQQIFEERHRQDAEAQLAWEEAARRDYEARGTATKADDA